MATLNHVVDCASSVSAAAREAAVSLLSMCPPGHLTHAAVLVQAALPCAEDALHARGDLALRRRYVPAPILLLLWWTID